MKNNFPNSFNNKKILFMIPTGLGDFIKSLGIFSSIKKQYPTAILDIAIVNDGVNTLKNFVSYIDDIITLNIKKFTFFDYFLYFLFKGWKDIKKINSKKHDLVICLTLNPLRRYLLTFIKAKNKIVFPITGTDVIKEYNFISNLEIKIIQQQISLFDKLDDSERVVPLLPLLHNKKNIIINMFCADSPNSVRDWQKWGELIEKIADKFNIILIGKADFNYKKYYKLDYSKVVDLINKIDLKSLVFLFRKSDLVITVDSFPFHLAYAVGAPVVGLFGPVDPETRIPPSVSRKNIYYLYNNKYNEVKLMVGNKLKKELKRNRNVYMDNIDVEDVVGKINDIFK